MSIQLDKKSNSKKLVDLLFEVGLLSKIKRSGLSFLGTGNQSISEHTFRAIVIGYLLVKESGEQINLLKVMAMLLFHDLPETRIGDLNWENKKFLSINYIKLMEDLKNDYPFAEDILECINEFDQGQSFESIIARDADQLEFLITLKEEYDIGNLRAKNWISPIAKRLKTDIAKRICNLILESNIDNWWFSDKENTYWVDGNE